MRQKTFMALAGFLALLILSTIAFGVTVIDPGTYYVDINQTIEGDGTAGNPWKTLHNAILQINSGNPGTYVLNVAAGTYSLTNGEDDSQIILTQSDVTIQGSGPGSTILDGTAAESWTPGIGTSSASNVIIKDMEIRYFSCYGISIYAGSGNVIQGCEIHNNNSGGILVENSSPYIRQNEIYDNYLYGIYVDDCSETASPDIWNNLIYDTGGNMYYGIYLISSYGVMSVEPRIYHNTLDGGLYDGIFIGGYGGNAAPDIQNNIITNFSQYGISNDGGSPTIDFNDVWHNGPSEPYDQNYSGCTKGTNDISQDPLYAGYELQSGSPCIDAIPTTDPPGDPVDTDFLGYTRPKGSGYDMGAYEYGALPPGGPYDVSFKVTLEGSPLDGATVLLYSDVNSMPEVDGETDTSGLVSDSGDTVFTLDQGDYTALILSGTTAIVKTISLSSAGEIDIDVYTEWFERKTLTINARKIDSTDPLSGNVKISISGAWPRTIGSLIGGTIDLQVTPYTYYYIGIWSYSDLYFLYEGNVEVTDNRSLNFYPTSANDTTVTVTLDDFGTGYFLPWLEDPNLFSAPNYAIPSPVVMTPGQYSIWVYLEKESWKFYTHLVEYHTFAAGAETYDAGGTLTINTFSTNRETYVPGDTVSFSFDIQDGYGNSIYWSYQPDSVINYPTIVITDPDNNEVYSGNTTGFSSHSHILGTTEGIYTATLTFDTGSHQGEVSRSTEFWVSAADADSDNDNMPDAWEYENFGDLSHDGTADGDSDGLTDLQEYENGSNPADADTDDDNYYDAEEVSLSTDPADDSDYPSYSPSTYYVNISSGNDLTGDGTSDTPWKTFHHALYRVNNGESTGSYTINVALGTYSTANSEADQSMAITQDDVTIIGESGSMPVLDGTDASIWMIGIEVAGSNVIIKNLTVKSFADWGLRISSGTGALINSCEIYDNGLVEAGGGIHVENCSPEIRKNKIHDNHLTGIFIAGDRADASPRIEKNEIYDNNIGISVNGIYSGGSASPSITNNLIYDTSSTVAYGIQVLGATSGTASPTIYHNTIDQGLSYGIYIVNVGGTTTPDIKYNIMSNFEGYGINNIAGSPTIDYNNVWNNTEGTCNNCSQGTNGISEDPLFGSYALQSTSPCIDAIPPDSSDPVTSDYAGYARPKGSGYDMGAYEFIADIAHGFALPGGTGDATDYQMFTVPVTLESGSSLKQSMESALGTYDKGIWRVFAWDPGTSSYIEMDDSAFDSLEVYPGRGFWVISTSTDTITFSGQPAPDGDYTEVPLSPGWNMMALPWPATSIELDEIAVSDGLTTHFITNTTNSLTQQHVWDYTGTGANNGYEKLASGATLQPGKAYWIKVEAATDIVMLVPKDNEGGYFTATSVRAASEASTNPEDTEQPPPPPGLSVSFDSTSSDGGTRVSGSGGCFIGTVTPME